MTQLNDDEIYVLRYMLGLSKSNKTNPTRNRSHGIDERYFPVIKELQQRDYVTSKSNMDGSAFKTHYYLVTLAGIEAIRDQPWQD